MLTSATCCSCVFVCARLTSCALSRTSGHTTGQNLGLVCVKQYVSLFENNKVVISRNPKTNGHNFIVGADYLGDMLYKELVTEGMVMMQVLANPTADIQEGPKVTKAELKARGVRPYDEKVHTALSPQHCLKAGPCCYTCLHFTSSLKHKEPNQLWCMQADLQSQL